MTEQKFVTLFDRKTDYDFVGVGRTITKIGMALAAVTLLAIPVIGLNWGIDFAGGTELQVKFNKTVEAPAITASLQKAGFEKSQVQPYGASSANEWLVRVERIATVGATERDSVGKALGEAFGDRFVRLDVSDDKGDRVGVILKVPGSSDDVVAQQAALDADQQLLAELIENKAGIRLRRTRQVDGTESTTAEAIVRDEPHQGTVTFLVQFQGVADKVGKGLEADFGQFEIRRVDFVDARVAEGLRSQGVMALIFALAAIVIYLAVRFDAFFAPGALVATLHDPLIAMGVFTFGRVEFDTASIAALLTVIGYSVNGVIVIYDRVRETMPAGPLSNEDLVPVVNKAVNDTFARSINTVLTTLFTTVAVAVFTDGSIRNFAVVLSAGFVIGTISALFIGPTVYLFFRKNFYTPEAVVDGAITREDTERGVV
jgi:preprotein translocase subunit SecF